jgi:hypothetical protein
MRKALVILVFIGAVLSNVPAQAQEGVPTAPSSGKFSLYSKPSGAFVYLEGDYDFIGRTPCEVPFGVEGSYRVKALKRGYENWATRVMLVGDQENSLYIKLVPKTRLKAALRSVIFPGWGQYYTDRKAKGVVFGLLQIGSIVGTIYAYQNYEDAKDDFAKAADRYRQEKLVAKLPQLKADMRAKRREADNAWELRNTFYALTAGVWAYNVLETVLFFPRYEQDMYRGATPMISSSIDHQGAKIIIAQNF